MCRRAGIDLRRKDDAVYQAGRLEWRLYEWDDERGRLWLGLLTEADLT